ncbi:MAG: DUF4112 domain-containing protein [Leucothrix sp.]
MPTKPSAAQQAENQRKLKSLDRLAWLLDSSIKIPGTNRTVGLDGIIGLVPGIGDVFAGLLSGYIIIKALLMGLPIFVIAQMVMNMILEGVIGVIPLFGDIFDFIFKSNRRNVRLMQSYFEDPKETAERSASSVIGFLVVLFFVFLLTIWLIFKVLGWATSLM